ncbi:STAS domain-containing protein [Actinocorallia longicatena]|uniref:STAS domain-containing protein n=1 Tax=Actinocorallia longicatena TaxID=111803 RepID=A0ABP6QG59_9ACTN
MTTRAGTASVRVRTAYLRLDGEFAYGSLRVAGRVEPVTGDLFATALNSMAEGCSGDVRVDLGKLEFIDLAGLRALLAVACRLMLQDRRLELVSMAPHLVELMVLVGWAEVPGLMLITPDAPSPMAPSRVRPRGRTREAAHNARFGRCRPVAVREETG